MPNNITSGRTNLLLSDWIRRAKISDPELQKKDASDVDLVDFIAPGEFAFPAYAKAYAGNYFDTSSGSSQPATFSAAKESTTLGNFYEEPIPADCMDDSVISFNVTFGAAGVVLPAKVIRSDIRTDWDLTLTDTVYWTVKGRKIDAFIPAQYSSSSPLSHWEEYTRFPIIPTVAEDQLDLPSEDVQAAYTTWIGFLQKV